MLTHAKRRWLLPALSICASAIGLYPLDARANVALQRCGLGAVEPYDSPIVVIYWTSNPNNDTLQESTFAAQMLAQPSPSSGGLIGTPYNDVFTQYYELEPYSCSGAPTIYCQNATFEQTILDVVTSPPPPTNPTSCDQEQKIVDQVATVHTGYQPVYVLQYPPGVPLCAKGCAYHSITKKGNPYIALPYVTAGNQGCGGPNWYDVQASNINHEFAELSTDTNPALGWRAPAGQMPGGAGEIGDGPCEDYGKFPEREVQLFPRGSVPWFQVGIQSLWSNQAGAFHWGGCTYARPTMSVNWYVGSNSHIWQQLATNNAGYDWGGFTYGANIASAASAASWGPLRHDIFAYDSNGHLGHIYIQADGSEFSDDWGPPPSGDSFTRRPDVTSWGNGNLELVANVTSSGSESVLFRTWENGFDYGWSELYAPAAGVASAATIVSWGVNEADVFVLGRDGNLYRKHSSDGSALGFDNWTSVGAPLGETLTGDPDAASWMPGRLDVYFVNSAGNLSHFIHDDTLNPPYETWDTWTAPTGYTLTGSPSAVGMGDYRIKVVGVTTTGSFAEWLWDAFNVTSGVLGANFAPRFNASSVVAADLP